MNVGPDAPVIENAQGGKQSDPGCRMDLVPAKAILKVGEVLDQGARKYGTGNWEKLDPKDIVNHVLVHLYAWLAGDSSDEHLSHAACRCLMALELTL